MDHKDISMLSSVLSMFSTQQSSFMFKIFNGFPHSLAAQRAVQNISVYRGTTDVVKQKSEVLKQDLSDLLNTLSSLNSAVFIWPTSQPVSFKFLRF